MPSFYVSERSFCDGVTLSSAGAISDRPEDKIRANDDFWQDALGRAAQRSTWPPGAERALVCVEPHASPGSGFAHQVRLSVFSEEAAEYALSQADLRRTAEQTPCQKARPTRQPLVAKPAVG